MIWRCASQGERGCSTRGKRNRDTGLNQRPTIGEETDASRILRPHAALGSCARTQTDDSPRATARTPEKRWMIQADRGTVSMVEGGEVGGKEITPQSSRSPGSGAEEGAREMSAMPSPGELPATSGRSSQPHGQRAVNTVR